MKYNNYDENKCYSIKVLNNFWKTKEKKHEITIIKKDYIMFKKVNTDPYLLSKINYCRRASIKMKIIKEVLNNIYFNNKFLPEEIKNIIVSFIGYSDLLYFNNTNNFKLLNYFGCYEPYNKK